MPVPSVYLATMLECSAVTLEWGPSAQAVFDTYEEARSYLLSLVDDDQRDVRDAFFEIEFFHVGDREPWRNMHIWRLDLHGSILHEIDAAQWLSRDPVHTPRANQIEFQVGDVVMVEPYPWNPCGTLWQEWVGVVAALPDEAPGGDSHDTPDEAGALELDEVREVQTRYADDEYTVVHINPEGFLEHQHVRQGALRRFEGELPSDLGFLAEYAQYVKGERIIPDDVIRQIYEQKLEVRRTPRYEGVEQAIAPTG